MSTKPKPIKVFISAGEASGDMHAAGVMKALEKQYNDVSVSAIAGPAMREVGCEVLCPMESLNVMGIGDVLKALPRIRRIGKDICDWAGHAQPDVAILVDFAGFNMSLGEKLRKLGIPVLYYIAPKLWAWGHWRVKRLQRAQDCLACILPFEPKWFAEKGIDAHYVGNPSVLACQHGWSQEQLKQKLGMGVETPLLALLPGSRRSELTIHVGLLAEAYLRIKEQFPALVAVTTRAPGVSDQQLKPLLDAGVQVLDRLDDDYALRADAAIAVSGTATLELALWNV
ncbi:MAG: lipid-A-disaccharide synthase, partial [Mariprofundaceae bacterium]|nr:lipid-A-disaccharide synthase [Mariprofundaceae bacterium]